MNRRLYHNLCTVQGYFIIINSHLAVRCFFTVCPHWPKMSKCEAVHSYVGGGSHRFFNRLLLGFGDRLVQPIHTASQSWVPSVTLFAAASGGSTGIFYLESSTISWQNPYDGPKKVGALAISCLWSCIIRVRTRDQGHFGKKMCILLSWFRSSDNYVVIVPHLYYVGFMIVGGKPT